MYYSWCAFFIYIETITFLQFMVREYHSSFCYSIYRKHNWDSLKHTYMELVLINISWHEICIKSTNKNIRCHFKWQFINTFFYIFSNIWYFAYMFIYYMCICLELNLSNFTFSMGWIQLQMTIVNEFKDTWHKRHRRILNKVSFESNFNCRKPFYSVLLDFI